jgi:glutamate dehydrogenase (NAD(P)+)
MGVQMQVLVNDPKGELSAYVVVDSVRNGRAMGGTRMTTDVTLTEVAGLARAMTLKLALAGLPIGGAKAGIACGLPAGPERDRRIAEFGRAVAPLLHGGIYLGADQGITHRDRDLFFGAAGFDVGHTAVPGLPCAWADLWGRCHEVTGFGVCQAIVTAMTELGWPDGSHSVAIQGFGLVGRAVARAMSERGDRVVAVADRDGTVVAAQGLPVDILLAATDGAGSIDRGQLPADLARTSSVDAWLDTDADIVVLAAGGAAVRADNVARVRAKMVVEAGNLACTEEAATILAARSTPVLPGIVVNSGAAAVTGLLLLGQAPTDLGVDELVEWLFWHVGLRIRENITALLVRGATDPRSLDQLALEMAEERLAAMESSAEPDERSGPVLISAG